MNVFFFSFSFEYQGRSSSTTLELEGAFRSVNAARLGSRVEVAKYVDVHKNAASNESKTMKVPRKVRITALFEGYVNLMNSFERPLGRVNVRSTRPKEREEGSFVSEARMSVEDFI